MGIDVTIVDEVGGIVAGPVGDPTNILHRLLPSEPQFVLLTAIDWYGNTIFNRMQIPRFLREWESVETSASDDEERRLVAAIRGMAAQVGTEVHLYLRFDGD